MRAEIHYIVIVTAAILFALSLKFLYPNFNEKKVCKILTILLIIYAVFLCIATVVRFYNFQSEVTDLTYYHTVVLQLAKFQTPVFVHWEPVRYIWGDHFEPILTFFVPLYWIFPRPSVLFIIQAIIAISGIIPIYLSSKKVLSHPFICIALAWSYLLFGGMQYGYEYGFHPIVFFPTLFLWAYYFYLHKRKMAYVFFLFLCLTLKEEVAFIVIFWGLYIVLKKNFSTGVLTILLGVFWYILAFHFVIPHYNNGIISHTGQYGFTGNKGIFGLFSTIVENPVRFLHILVTPSYKLETVFHLFGSFAFIPLLFPPSIIIMIPSLLIKLLSNNIAGLNGAHYSATMVGLIIVASIETLSIIHTKPYYKKLRSVPYKYFAVVIIYTAFAAHLAYPHIHFRIFAVLSDINKLFSEDTKDVYRVVKIIPKNATVTTQIQIIPHLNQEYSNIYQIPDTTKTDYIVFDPKIPVPLTPIEDYNQYIRTAVKSADYEIIYTNNQLFLLKHKNQ